MSELNLTRDEAARLDADGRVVLFREGGYEVCFVCNGHDISHSGDVSSSCDSCSGGGVPTGRNHRIIRIIRIIRRGFNTPPAEFTTAAEPCGMCRGRKGRWEKDGPHDRWEPCDECRETGKRRIAVAGRDVIDHSGGGGVSWETVEQVLVPVGTVVVEWGPLPVDETITVGQACLVVVDGGYDWKGKKPPIIFRYRPGTGLPLERLDVPPDVDPSTLVGQYALSIRKVSDD